MPLLTLSRRSLGVGLALAALGAPRAFSAPSALRFPLSIGYARIGENGLSRITTRDQTRWSGLQTRLGALVERIEPLQPASLLGAKAPELDGGASCVLLARAQAADLGLPLVLVYATEEKPRTFDARRNWFSRGFASIRSALAPHHPALGEAHLLDTAGGPALASAYADAPPRKPLNPFDNHRRPQEEALDSLITSLEQQFQSAVEGGFMAGRSRADN